MRIAEVVPVGRFVKLNNQTASVGGGGSGRNPHHRTMVIPPIRTISNAICDFFIDF